MELAHALVDELRRTAPVHTVILYGSRARGDATPDSDLDVAAFADVATTTRDARRWRGLYLDGFVYPTAVATAAPDAELLKLRGGTVLLDERGLAGPLMAALDALHGAGPPPITDDDRQMRRVWAHKMLARIARDDIEAHYRRHWLLYQLLEDHFAYAGAWYLGPKRALAALAIDAPALHAAFAAALAPGADLPTIAALVAQVCGPDGPLDGPVDGPDR